MQDTLRHAGFQVFQIVRKTDESARSQCPARNTRPVSFYEKRKKIYAKGVRVFFDNWRITLVIFTQILFYVSPWLV